MILLNTTYFVSDAIMPQFMEWMHQSLMPSVKASTFLTAPILSRMLQKTEPHTTAIALQVQAPDTAQAQEWIDGQWIEIFNIIARKHPGQIIPFTSMLEII